MHYPPPIPVVLIGAGQRGADAYATYALRRPEDMRVVAIAEPDDIRRDYVADQHNIPYKRRFRTWEDLLDAPLLADVALVCTPDMQHAAPAMGAMQYGYDVLLETPLAPTYAECLQLLEVAEYTQQRLMSSYGLRYTAFYRAMSALVKSGRLGTIQNYQQDRNIASWNFAHQFLRHPSVQGENPMLLIEGLHEFDLLLWLLGEDRIEKVNSMGNARQFDPNHAPRKDVPQLCVSNCPIEADCAFSAKGIYLDQRFLDMPTEGYPYTALMKGEATPESIAGAIEMTPWGDCVYHSQRQIIDFQTIRMRTQSGAKVSLTINGRSEKESRRIHMDGSKGSLLAEFIGVDSHVTFTAHESDDKKTIKFRIGANGHGGDHGLMGSIVKLIRGEGESLTLVQDTIDAHLLAFAAERARQTDQPVDVTAYQAQHSPLT